MSGPGTFVFPRCFWNPRSNYNHVAATYISLCHSFILFLPACRHALPAQRDIRALRSARRHGWENEQLPTK